LPVDFDVRQDGAVSNRELIDQQLDACCVPLDHEPLTPGQADALARGFKAVGDPIRLRLLSLIASTEGGEACVCDLTGTFALTGPTISHHLKVLREAGLITGERRGTWVYYRAVPDAMRQLAVVLMPTDEPVA
jgi:ArsR family transcriptional regulator